MDNSFLIRLGLDTQQLVAGVAKSNSILQGFQNQITSLGRSVAGGLGFYGLSSAIVGSVESMAGFSHAMSEVKAITGATGEEFTALRNNALNLAGSFRAIDIARLETEFARLGFSTQEILNATKATIQLATATGEDLAKSAQIAGSVIRAFNLDASQMGRVGDVMASGFNKSALSLNDFGEAMKYVAPVAANAGLSLEQVTAALGVLADANIKGSMAGTSLRKIISDLGQGSGPIFTQKLREMADAGLSGAGAMDEVGRTAYSSLLVLAHNIEKLDLYTDAAKNSKGELEQMSAIMQDDLVGDWKKFNAAIDQTIQKGTPLEAGLRNIARAATDVVNAINGNKESEGLSKLRRDADGLNELFKTGFTNRAAYSSNFASNNQETIFKKLEEDASKAGVSLKAFLKDYDLIKATLFGGSPIGPNPAKPFQAEPFGNAKAPQAFDKGAMRDTTSMLGTGWVSDVLKDTNKALQDLKINVNDSSQAYQEFFGSVDMANDALKLEAEQIDPAVTAQTDKLVESHNRLKNSMVSTAMSAKQMGNLLRQVYTDVIIGMSKAMGQLASGLNGGEIEKGLLSGLANIMVQVGEMAIMIGVSLLGIKEALETLDPFVAIAAGAALVALGTYFAARSAQIGSQISGGGSGGSTAPSVGPLGRGSTTQEQLVTRISGTDLMVVLQRQTDQDSMSKQGFAFLRQRN
jgi:hypothetical protein